MKNDPFENIISEWIKSTKLTITTDNILKDALKLKLNEFNLSNRMRVHSVMSKLGFTAGKINNVRMWIKK